MKKLKLNAILQEKLNRLDNPPKELGYIGADINHLAKKPMVAIVGTRKPTPYGQMMTEKITSELARAGVVIVSGLALGVDCLSHVACLDAGGETIAVLPSGLENVYPATNRDVANRIQKNSGSLVSEYEPKHKPKKVEFLERNRIIAALSDVVIIPEAAGNSGSLNTANHAQKMGIPIMAVPGNVTSPMSEGTNFLLKQGAKAITNASDVLENLGINSNKKQLVLNLEGDTPEETLVLQKLAKGYTDQHSLQVETKLSASELQTTLTMLEVQSRITQDQLGNFTLM